VALALQSTSDLLSAMSPPVPLYRLASEVGRLEYPSRHREVEYGTRLSRLKLCAMEHHTFACSNFREISERVALVARVLATGTPDRGVEHPEP